MPQSNVNSIKDKTAHMWLFIFHLWHQQQDSLYTKHRANTLVNLLKTVHRGTCSSMIKKQAAGAVAITATTSRSEHPATYSCVPQSESVCSFCQRATNTQKKNRRVDGETTGNKGSLVNKQSWAKASTTDTSSEKHTLVSRRRLHSEGSHCKKKKKKKSPQSQAANSYSQVSAEIHQGTKGILHTCGNNLISCYQPNKWTIHSTHSFQVL